MRRREVFVLVGGAAVAACGAPAAAAVPSVSPAPSLPSLHPGVDVPARPKIAPMSPLSADERSARLLHAKALAREADASAFFVTSGTTAFTYLVGTSVERSERLIALVVPVQGDAFVTGPAFERERLAPALGALPFVPWEEHESPFERIAARLGGAQRLLVEPHVEYGAAAALARAVKGAALVDGSAAAESLRIAKSEGELARLRRAVEITHFVFDDVLRSLRVGVTDVEIAQRVKDGFKAFGVGGYALVQLGDGTAMPHGHPHGAKLAEEMPVLLDGGCSVEGYWSDITRTHWFGRRVPADFARVYGLVREAQDAALAVARIGTPLESIDAAARGVITKGGHGPAFTHRLGHGMGLDGHEPPYLVQGNARTLGEGAVFSVEPGIYLPGRFGVRLEDDVLATAAGPVVLSRRAPPLLGGA